MSKNIENENNEVYREKKIPSHRIIAEYINLW